MDRRSLLDRAAKSAEERVLLGHILDKYDQCRQRNLPTNTAFLSPAEAQGARDLLRAAAIHEGFALLGGYEGAERRMLFFLPDWQEEADASDAMAFLRAAWHESEHPTHRDLLGSLMALGVERETLGDILVSEGSADLIVSAGVAQYLLDNWTGAGRTALRLTAIGADALRGTWVQVSAIILALITVFVGSYMGTTGHGGDAAARRRDRRGLFHEPRQGCGADRRGTCAEKLSRGHQGRRERGTGRRHFRAGTGKI